MNVYTFAWQYTVLFSEVIVIYLKKNGDQFTTKLLCSFLKLNIIYAYEICMLTIIQILKKQHAALL